MATYFYNDFSSVPTGWTERWNTSPTWTGANPLQIPNGVTGDWIGISVDALDSDADRDDVELLIKFTTPSAIGTQRLFMVRGAGADESATHYHWSHASSLHSIGYCSGSDTRTNIQSYNAAVFNTSTTYWVRLRVNSNSLRVRAWADGAGEPSTWDIDTTDSNVTGVGWIAIGQGGGNITGPTISQIGIGTNGDTAPASGSSNTAINPGVGNITITGHAPTVAQSANQALTPGVGNLTITGYAPTIAQSDNKNITADVGNLVITGYAPTVTQGAGQNIAPGVGSLALSGHAPTVAQTANQNVTPDVGSLTITGHAPTITQSGGVNIVPNSGTLLITGYPPTVARTENQNITPAVGGMTITGYPPTIAQTAGTNVRPDPGTITITGYAPTIAQTQNNNINPPQGQITITGYAPTVVRTTGGGGGISAADIWTYEIEAGKTAEELMRLMAAVLLGKTTVTDLGGGNALVTFEAANGTKIRITATMAGSERTAMSFDETF